MSDTSTMTVVFNRVNGDPIGFQVDVDQVRQRNLASSIESALSSNYVGVVLEEKLIIVPTHNITSIELSPVADVLIKSVVTDAKPIGS